VAAPRDREQRLHAHARERGVSPALYRGVRALVRAVLRAWFRVRVAGLDQIPREGAAIIAPNHKNFLDPFFIGIVADRPVRYMAKHELFRGPLGWLFPRLGAFPVRRGEADAEALATARRILDDGGLVVVFPEGTRVAEPDALGSPHHGAGRLAVEAGAPIIPAAISGTAHLWRGALPRLKRVQLAFLPAVTAGPSDDPAALTQLIDEQVWPAVQEEYGRLRASPGLIAAGLAALGLGGGLVTRRLRRPAERPRLVGMVQPRGARRHSRRARLAQRLRRR
jgi:1-acyl-sn-glycerol-3-phosphate acyltransferase